MCILGLITCCPNCSFRSSDSNKNQGPFKVQFEFKGENSDWEKLVFDYNYLVDKTRYRIAYVEKEKENLNLSEAFEVFIQLI